uniref:MARVEL domain-containing protein n=1 Tax=Caenorhabditis tropicalis TaxID=1561998 RepID=A0A1I7UIY8_9PELO
MSLKNETPGSVTILQAIVFLQFGICFGITVFTTIGLAFGYPIASFYLMALLQVIVAVPGIVFVALHQNIWIAVYTSFQLVTASCEVYWLVYMIFDQRSAGGWLGLSIVTAVNIAAVVVALWFRHTAIKFPCIKKIKENKPEMKVPSTSMSELEKPKNAASKSTSSIKKSPSAKSSSEKSSKGSLKVRKVKKALPMPLDSRETTSRSRTSDASETNLDLSLNSA